MSPTTFASAPSPLASTPAPLGRAERWTRLSGIAASLAIFFSGAFAPNPPTHGGTDAAMLEHFRVHHDGTMQSVFVWIGGALALLLFAATAVRAAERARRAAGREWGLASLCTLLMGMAAVGMLLAAQAGAAATAAVGHHATDATLLRALDEIGHMLAHLSVLPLGLFTLCLALTLRDARPGSRWLTGLGVTIGGVMAISGVWVFVGQRWLHDAGGFTWLFSMLWWIAASVSLWRAGRPVAAQGAAVPVAEARAA